MPISYGGAEVTKLAIDPAVIDKIILERGTNSYRQGRGWQSANYSTYTFDWFESVYSAIEQELGTIDSWWFNINLLGEATGWHSHPQWRRVAVLYAQVPGGAIEFRHGGNYWQESPESDSLLVFPGTLEHRVLPNTSNEPRISIAFNFKQ